MAYTNVKAMYQRHKDIGNLMVFLPVAVKKEFIEEKYANRDNNNSPGKDYDYSKSYMNEDVGVKIKEEKGVTEEPEIIQDVNHIPPHQCIHCNKTFFQNKDLIIHLNKHLRVLIHKLNPQTIPVPVSVEIKPYQCSHCERTFYENKDLTIHLKDHLRVLIHKLDPQIKPVPVSVEIKPYQCSHCDRTYFDNKDLTIHLNKHLRVLIHKLDPQTIQVPVSVEIKPYQCCHCERTFFENKDLSIHLRRHLRVLVHKLDPQTIIPVSMEIKP
ncbi:unnamed protein product [Meganyctiphanes norvegica]|uniref:C2H2-type domain-containing protein n=1 Tax=Meganyctiphanes norvegica TaxID=48144 RepID=A0AAV2Q3N6_MEGNR